MIIENHKNESANELDAALKHAHSLLTPEDINLMKSNNLAIAIAKLHLTLGAQLRAELNLWDEKSSSLQNEIALATDYPILDADSAASGLIEILWRELHK